MDEFIEVLEKGDTEEAARETADVLILLNRLGTTLSFNLLEAVDAKMKVNRACLFRPATEQAGIGTRAPAPSPATTAPVFRSGTRRVRRGRS
jgi:ATP phosphoribosyltransferase